LGSPALEVGENIKFISMSRDSLVLFARKNLRALSSQPDGAARAPLKTTKSCVIPQFILASVAVAGWLAASPASAANFNCFEWVRASAGHLIHARHIHHARAASPHKRLAHVHTSPRIHRIASPLVRRPVACPEHETALYSPMPGAPARETPQMLEAALAGPPAAAEAGRDTAAVVPAPIEGPLPFFPGGFPGGTPGPIGGPPGGILPAPGPIGGPPPPPSTVLPITPPDTIVPVVTPPGVTPPLVNPPGDTPPDVIRVPIISPPGPPDAGPGPVGGVPEPATWALMLLGVSGLGVALRRRRRVQFDIRPASTS
jgi:hypothetical protein